MNTENRKYQVDIVKKNVMKIVDDILQKNPNTTATIKMESVAVGQSHTVRVLFESTSDGLIWSLRGWLDCDEGVVDWEKLTEENISPIVEIDG